MPTDVVDLESCPQPLRVFLPPNGEMVVSIIVGPFLDMVYGDEPRSSDPGFWGVILSDVLMHMARAHRETLLRSPLPPGKEVPSEAALRSRIIKVFLEEAKLGDEHITHTIHKRDKEGSS